MATGTWVAGQNRPSRRREHRPIARSLSQHTAELSPDRTQFFPQAVTSLLWRHENYSCFLLTYFLLSFSVLSGVLFICISLSFLSFVSYLSLGSSSSAIMCRNETIQTWTKIRIFSSVSCCMQFKLSSSHASKISNFHQHKRQDTNINRETWALFHLKLPAEEFYPQKYVKTITPVLHRRI
jgi:hypothetical protein